MKNKIACVVVLYHPDTDLIHNIESYMHDVDVLFCIDNSEVTSPELVLQLESYENVEYLNNNGNIGLAASLNRGADLAIARGADWLLTMDQDSAFGNDALGKMRSAIESLSVADIGILSADHQLGLGQSHNTESIKEVETVMTSGNFLNLSAYQQVGPFRNDFFIDYIDHEYCLRLRKSNFRVMQCQGAVLHHRLGNLMRTTIGSREVQYTNHNALRRYYLTRNRLVVAFAYRADFPSFFWAELRAILNEWVKILLFEENKMRKNRMIIKGVFDFMFGRMGKLDVASCLQSDR